MKCLRLTIFMACSMHIIIMYPNIKYWENICNRLRDIQQKKNRKFRNVKCEQRTSLKSVEIYEMLVIQDGGLNKIKNRFFKSNEYISEKGDGSYRGFGYLSLFSDHEDSATCSQR